LERVLGAFCARSKSKYLLRPTNENLGIVRVRELHQTSAVNTELALVEAARRFSEMRKELTSYDLETVKVKILTEVDNLISLLQGGHFTGIV
jgi:hypothetical protein